MPPSFEQLETIKRRIKDSFGLFEIEVRSLGGWARHLLFDYCLGVVRVPYLLYGARHDDMTYGCLMLWAD